MSNLDGIDDYNNSVWRKLGHPAFEDNPLDGVEWWDTNDDSEEE